MADWMKSAWLSASRFLMGMTGMTHADANRRVIDEKQSEAYRGMNQRIVYDRLKAEPGLPFASLLAKMAGPEEERLAYFEWLYTEGRVTTEPGAEGMRCSLVEAEWPDSVKGVGGGVDEAGPRGG